MALKRKLDHCTEDFWLSREILIIVLMIFGSQKKSSCLYWWLLALYTTEFADHCASMLLVIFDSSPSIFSKNKQTAPPHLKLRTDLPSGEKPPSRWPLEDESEKKGWLGFMLRLPPPYRLFIFSHKKQSKNSNNLIFVKFRI